MVESSSLEEVAHPTHTLEETPTQPSVPHLQSPSRNKRTYLPFFSVCGSRVGAWKKYKCVTIQGLKESSLSPNVPISGAKFIEGEKKITTGQRSIYATCAPFYDREVHVSGGATPKTNLKD